MIRTTYVTRDFFLPLGEEDARQLLLRLPARTGRLEYLGPHLQNLRFSFRYSDSEPPHFVEAGGLPLDAGFTKITLHASYGNGVPLQDDRYLAATLYRLERELLDAAAGRPVQPEAERGAESTPLVSRILRYLSPNGQIQKLFLRITH